MEFVVYIKESGGKDIILKKELIKIPAVALRGLTVFPDMIIHFDLSRQKSITAVEMAMMDDQKVFLVTQKNLDDETPIPRFILIFFRRSPRQS